MSLTARLVNAAALLTMTDDQSVNRRIERALQDLCDKERGVLRWLERGRTKVRAVELAQRNCDDWIDICGVRLNGWERGGSRSDGEENEAAEVRKVHRQALRDVNEFDGLSRSIEAGAKLIGRDAATICSIEAPRSAQRSAVLIEVEGDCRRLAGIVARYVVVTDHSGLAAPGCRSCARVGEWAEVLDKAKHVGRCRWCSDHRVGGRLPLVEAVRLRHEKGPRAASLWLARQKVGTEAYKALLSDP